MQEQEIKNKGLKGLRVIDKNLDVANFIRFNLQTRGLLKQLFDSEKRRAAKDFKNHIDSDQVGSDGSSEPDGPIKNTHMVPPPDLIHTENTQK